MNMKASSQTPLNITLILKVNPKNGTVTLPKKFREQYKISDSLVLSVTPTFAKIKPTPMTLEELFSKPIDPSKFVSDEDIEKGLEEMRSNIKF
jgi:bifunctional DNA-binding transcriptional regulator/antitoxin component of YhaV-PrlF toxin-antitoxin module